MNERVLITGDIHNEFDRLNVLINKKKPDRVFCCGDFGYWPGKARPLSDIKLQGTKEIRWCDVKVMRQIPGSFINQEDQLIHFRMGELYYSWAGQILLINSGEN